MTNPDPTGPRILLPTDDPVARTQATFDRAERDAATELPAIEMFFEAVGPGVDARLLAWHLARQRSMQISKPMVVDVAGTPYVLVVANSVEFVSAQWAVSLAIELRNHKAAKDAQRQVSSEIQAAPAGLAMPPPSHPEHRGPRRR